LNEIQRSAEHQQPWLWAFLGLALTVVAGVLFLPVGSLADRLHMIVHGVCAQAHYIEIGSYTMPLCARNTGIYAGFLATVLYLLALGRRRAAKLPPLPITILLGLAIIVMGIDGFNSMALDVGGYNVYTPRNTLRVITGLGMGMALGAFLLFMFILYALLFFAPTWLFYPLALFSVLGIVGVLFMSNVFVVAMISGLESRVLKLHQLARPATISIVLTAVELSLLAGLRVWVEHSVGQL
jgi:uncharacterized membrane protein